MTEVKKGRALGGYEPLKRGYQPEATPATPSEPIPEGYQPEANGGNQDNQPAPPREE